VLAANPFNPEALLDTFSEKALVNNQLREYRGKAAIKKRAVDNIISDHLTKVRRGDGGTLRTRQRYGECRRGHVGEVCRCPGGHVLFFHSQR
jgi:hypothetical protein